MTQVKELEWRTVPGFEKFRISEKGDLMSSLGANKSWRSLRPSLSSTGYLQHTLPDRKHHTIHSLVLLAFVGPRPKGTMCCHKDGNKTNNHISNLRWGTMKENKADDYGNGIIRFGSKNPETKLTDKQRYDIKLRYLEGESQSALGKEFGLSQSTISFLVTRKYNPPFAERISQ